MLDFKKKLKLSMIVPVLTLSILCLCNAKKTNAADLIYKPLEDQSIPNSFLLNIRFNTIEEFAFEINQILNNSDTISDPPPPEPSDPPELEPQNPPIVIEIDIEIEEMIANSLRELIEQIERELLEEDENLLDQITKNFKPEPLDPEEQPEPLFLEFRDVPEEIVDQAFTIPLKPRLQENRELRNNLRNNENLQTFITKVPEPNFVISLLLFSSLGFISTIRKNKL